MKTAKQWMLTKENPNLETHIELIQLDALEHAASLLTANADSPTRGFNAIHRLIVKLKSKTVAATPNIKAEPPPVSGGEAQGKLSNEN